MSWLEDNPWIQVLKNRGQDRELSNLSKLSKQKPRTNNNTNTNTVLINKQKRKDSYFQLAKQYFLSHHPSREEFLKYMLGLGCSYFTAIGYYYVLRKYLR